MLKSYTWISGKNVKLLLENLGLNKTKTEPVIKLLEARVLTDFQKLKVFFFLKNDFFGKKNDMIIPVNSFRKRLILNPLAVLIVTPNLN